MKKTFFAALSGTLILCGCTSLGISAENHSVKSKAAGRNDSARNLSASAAGRNYSARNLSASSDSIALSERSAGGSNSYFQQSSRMMAYSAGFTLTVKKQSTALDEVKKLAESLGGYLVSSRRGNMQLKVPVAKADEFLEKSGKIGKKSDFRISAEDLTDTITDLGVRLDNLRKLRTRLTELLKKAESVEAMLKVERELNRVTTEIERIDAQLQNNKNRVAFVTFEVAVIEEHGAVPGGTPVAFDRFGFLKKLASNSGGLKSEPLFDIALPAGFVAVREGGVQSGFAATTSDDCLFRTWDADVAADSTLEFWEKVIFRSLQNRKSFENIKIFPAELNGEKAMKITAQFNTSRGVQSYMAVIAVERNIFGSDTLQIVEFFGPQEAFEKHEKAVSAVLQK